MLSTQAMRDTIWFSPDIQEKIALEMTASFPIPVLRDGKMICRAFYHACSGLPPRVDFDLYPPSWIAEFSWENGQVLLLEERPAAFFGLTGDRFHPFAKVSYIALNEQALLAGLGDLPSRQYALDEAYDRLVPGWYGGEPVEPARKEHFLKLLASLVGEPLLPVYRRLGEPFFSWLHA